MWHSISLESTEEQKGATSQNTLCLCVRISRHLRMPLSPSTHTHTHTHLPLGPWQWQDLAQLLLDDSSWYCLHFFFRVCILESYLVKTPMLTPPMLCNSCYIYTAVSVYYTCVWICQHRYSCRGLDEWRLTQTHITAHLGPSWWHC